MANFNRRSFFTSTAALGAFGALSALTPDIAFARAAALGQREAFGGFLPIVGRNSDADLPLVQAKIVGKLPAAIKGALYRNGPALFERAGQRYQHPFDGDGFVQSWQFEAGRASFQGRFVRTKKFLEEKKAGKFQLATFGSVIPNMRAVKLPNEVNTANTSVIYHGGKLLAMWEGGEATSLNAKTLETEGIHTFRNDLAEMPFSAHPKLAPDGTLWNIGYIGSQVVLYEIASNGSLKRAELMKVPPSVIAGLPMMHDFAITANHLILLAPPMQLDRKAIQNGTPMGLASSWNGKASIKLVVVDKATLSDVKIYELPAAMVFHIGNAYETADEFVIDFVTFDSVNVMQNWMPKVMRDEEVSETQAPRSQLVSVRMDRRSNRARMTQSSMHVEFPRVDPRVVGAQNRYTYLPFFNDHRASQPSTRANRIWGFDGVMRMDWQTGQRQQFSYDQRYIVDEHVFVPRSASAPEGDGWLLGGYFDYQTKRSGLMVLDAQRLVDGPVARLELPYWTPMVFHGNFT